MRSVRSLDSSLANLDQITRDASAAGVGPLITSLRVAADSTDSALKQAEATLAVTEGAFDNHRSDGGDLAGAIRELKGAARSVRVLADYLETHPDSLLLVERSGEAMKAHFLCCALFALAVSACASSPQVRYYTLSTETDLKTRVSGATIVRRNSYAVGAVTIPELLDRPQIVLRSSAIRSKCWTMIAGPRLCLTNCSAFLSRTSQYVLAGIPSSIRG